MEDLRDHIEKIANTHLSDASHFIVEVIISSAKGPKKVLILLDGDQGVNIDDCADLSRAVGHEIEEKNLIEDAFRLEVSSPGVDYPLKTLRQYIKNIDRQVKITPHEGKALNGILKAVKDDKVVLLQEMKKGKMTEHKEVEIPLSEINKTIVQISFK